MRKIWFFLLIAGMVLARAQIEHEISVGITINVVYGKLNVTPTALVIKAAPNSWTEKTLTFWQETGNLDLTVSLTAGGGTAGWISFSESEFILGSDEENIGVFIDVPLTEPGIYYGSIIALTEDGQSLTIPVEIEVTDNYQIDVSIDVISRRTYAGESVNATVGLWKTGVEGDTTVYLVYEVRRMFGEIITTGTDEMTVVDYTEKDVSISLPPGIKRGLYVLKVTANHVNKTASDSDRFWIRKKKGRDIFSYFMELFF